MRIKKLIISITLIAIIVFVILLVITNSKNLWKLFGYTFCEKIEHIQIDSVTTNKDHIIIKGIGLTSDGYYSGYTYNIRNNVMYVGLKYNKYFGYDKVTKEFSIKIPYQVKEIEKVYLVDGTNQKTIAFIGGIN